MDSINPTTPDHPPPAGSYLLFLRLPTTLHQLAIGRLGRFDFLPGCYLYVGSGAGPGGLPARLKHHQKHTKPRPHWHIDYLRPYAHLEEVWTVSGLPHLEQQWCRTLSEVAELSTLARGFGASDSPCSSHLFYAPAHPHPASLSAALFRCLSFSHPKAQKLAITIHLL